MVIFLALTIVFSFFKFEKLLFDLRLLLMLLLNNLLIFNPSQLLLPNVLLFVVHKNQLVQFILVFVLIVVVVVSHDPLREATFIFFVRTARLNHLSARCDTVSNNQTR